LLYGRICSSMGLPCSIGERRKNRKWKKKSWETPFLCWSYREKGVLTRFLLVPLGSSPFFTRTHPPQLFDGTGPPPSNSHTHLLSGRSNSL
jgi:hypothetical protein